ncbi:MAG: hypothetical protein IK102_04230 [Treponema sp.]|nr:hypothetical protein [Treponema sp.]
MKKITCIITTLLILVGSIFAQEGHKWTDGLSAGGLFRLGIPTSGLEIHSRYAFPITKSIHVDAGLNINLCLSWYAYGGDAGVAFGGTSIIPNASVWYKDFYLHYGLGIGSASKTHFVPYDIRIGWQPGSTKKENGVCFNMEMGLIATPVEGIENGEVVSTTLFPGFFMTLGAMYKF